MLTTPLKYIIRTQNLRTVHVCKHVENFLKFLFTTSAFVKKKCLKISALRVTANVVATHCGFFLVSFPVNFFPSMKSLLKALDSFISCQDLIDLIKIQAVHGSSSNDCNYTVSCIQSPWCYVYTFCFLTQEQSIFYSQYALFFPINVGIPNWGRDFTI